MDSLGVYVHIPFCVQKCVYCDFLSGPATRQRHQEYVEALKREIERESAEYAEFEVKTIFFGGGTPSILEAEEIGGILDCIREHYRLDPNAEISMELNPKTAAGDKLTELRKAGINRLSIGLQSADNAELKLLGRIHTYEDFCRTYYQAREAGFRNINIDLMSGLPGQHMESWVQTLKNVLALQPEHISAYSLIIEEGTRLYDRLDEYPPIPDEEEDRQMYQETKRILAEYGYSRYEISNYAKKGYECRHNMIYWQRGVEHIADYVGFGLGAASTVKKKRWRNTSDMEQYLHAFCPEKHFGRREPGQQDSQRLSAAEKNRKEDIGFQPQSNRNLSKEESGKQTIKEDVEELSINDCMAEYMFLGLRMMCGVSKAEFAESFSKSMDEVYGAVLHQWIEQGMLIQEGGSIRLTDAGIDVSNVVLAEFLL
ncbi:MAG: radical SAM family heme chaperone HemW [Lachnospiraceae bacterium]|nr:radical SAM family heme chaperone HemW [Lachnospiraceae bacterium]